MVAQLVECSPRLQCRGFEVQLLLFPWEKGVVLGVVDLFALPLPFCLTFVLLSHVWWSSFKK